MRARGAFESCPATYPPAAPPLCRSCRHTPTPGQGGRAQGSGTPKPPTEWSAAPPRLWPSLRGGSQAAGPGPGGPRAVALQESGALAGVPGWPPLSSLSPHLGKAFPPARACGSGFHPDGKSHPGAPKGALSMETPRGACQAQGKWPLAAFREPGPQSCPPGGGGSRRGLAQDEVVRPLGAQGWACWGLFGHGCVSRKIRMRSPALSPLRLPEPRFPGPCPAWRLDCTQKVSKGKGPVNGEMGRRLLLSDSPQAQAAERTDDSLGGEGTQWASCHRAAELNTYGRKRLPKLSPKAPRGGLGGPPETGVLCPAGELRG